jgi:hypothetical protein
VWRQCPPGAQHGAKYLSGSPCAAWSVQPRRSTVCREWRPWPEANCSVVQGLPQRLKLLAAGFVKGLERRKPPLHGKLGGGSSGEVGCIAFHRNGARQAKAAVAEGKGELVGQGTARPSPLPYSICALFFESCAPRTTHQIAAHG